MGDVVGKVVFSLLWFVCHLYVRGCPRLMAGGMNP
jgi:hypothetical protein